MTPVDELTRSGNDVTAADLAQGSILFVGTATVNLRYAALTILTDPRFLGWGHHVHLGHGMKAIRRTDPSLELEALPPVDLVMLSHMHEDRIDREVERKCARGPPVITDLLCFGAVFHDLGPAAKHRRIAGWAKWQDLSDTRPLGRGVGG
jgi:L-ascorbate metabolism protein UlaG (beta-lactamase superfamily)